MSSAAGWMTGESQIDAESGGDSDLVKASLVLEVLSQGNLVQGKL